MNAIFWGPVIIQNELYCCKLLLHPCDLSVINMLYNIYIPIRTSTNNELTVHKYLHDSTWTNVWYPYISYIPCSPYHIWKKTLAICRVHKNTFEMAQNINRASHLPHFSLKECHSFILMQSGLLLLHIMHHYSE